MTNEELMIRVGQLKLRIERLEKENEKLRDMVASDPKANWCSCGALLLNSEEVYCSSDCEADDLKETIKFLHSGRV